MSELLRRLQSPRWIHWLTVGRNDGLINQFDNPEPTFIVR